MRELAFHCDERERHVRSRGEASGGGGQWGARQGGRRGRVTGEGFAYSSEHDITDDWYDAEASSDDEVCHQL